LNEKDDPGNDLEDLRMTATSMTAFGDWEETVCTVCGPLEATPMKGVPFKGGVNMRRVADVNLLEHHASVERLHWDRRHIAEIQAPYCYVILQLSQGQLFVTQNDNEARLDIGDWTIIDSLRPARFRFEKEFNILALNMPRDVITARAHDHDLPLAPFMSGSTGASAIFSSFARSLYDHAPSLNPDDVRHREHVLDLMFASLPGTFKQPERTRGRRLDAALRFIDEHLANPGLCPQMVAEKVNVSPRHLHRLFEETGHSVGDWIRKRRLERARCDLADERFRGNSILEISYGWGFNDSAHFSRAFRDAFGQSPREYRQQARRRN